MTSAPSEATVLSHMSSPCLILTCFLNAVCKFLNIPQWQELLPFGLGNPHSKMGFLSYDIPAPMSDIYFPNLPTYADFVADQGNNVSAWSLSTMMQFAKLPSTSLSDVTSSDSLLVLFLLVFFLRQLKACLIPFFCSLGRRAGRNSHGTDWEKENEERILKFGEYVFRLLYHSAVSTYGFYYFWDKPWWDPERGGIKLVFEGHPVHPVETGMVWYYLFQCAYNVDAMIALLELSFLFRLQNPFNASAGNLQSPIRITWNPNCRGDFQEMFAHHIITNCLIFGSSYSRFTRIGSMVFLVHDISDVPVDMSKLANFMKWKITTVVCFVTLMVVWAVTRLGILPFVIIKSSLFDAKILNTEGTMHDVHFHMYIPPFKLLLISINLLHVIWFAILLRIGYRLVTKGERHDLTEHKQGEDQGTRTVTKKEKAL